jgi:hypothetical protein
MRWSSANMVRPAWPCRLDHRAPARQRPGDTGVRGALPGHRRGCRDGASLAGSRRACHGGTRPGGLTAGGMARHPTPVCTPLSQGHEGNLTWPTVT